MTSRSSLTNADNLLEDRNLNKNHKDLNNEQLSLVKMILTYEMCMNDDSMKMVDQKLDIKLS